MAISCLVLLLAGCSINIGPLTPNPFVKDLNTFDSKQVEVTFSPDVKDVLHIESSSFKPVDITGYQSTLRAGYRNALSSSFQEVSFPDSNSKDGLVIKVDRFEPKPIKVGNVSMGKGNTVYEMKFKIYYEARLVKNGQIVSKTRGAVEGDETSWKKKDTPKLLNDAIEKAIAQSLQELFSDIPTSRK